MKRFWLICIVMASVASVTEANAQTRRRAPQRRANTGNQPVKVDTVVTPPVDSAKILAQMDTIPLRAVPESRRPTTTVVGNLVNDKTPLPYDQIRVDDQVYKQIVWREVDTREKMNLPFKYEADEDNGNQRFFNILLKHLKDGDITAFSNVNDRFTTPVSTADIATMLGGTAYTITKPDYERDPDGTLGILKDTTIRDEFDENSITAFRIKEEIIFDKETSRLHFRILGIAPVKTVKNEDGSYRDAYSLFWLYYPELRPVLAKYEAYNPRNMAMRMSWEEIFESRYFTSFIYKSTLNNPFDKPIAGMLSDPLMRLLEGENVKETIFNWEQNQWSY